MIANIPLSIPLIERGFGCIPKNCARFCPSIVLDPWSNFTITFWQGTWGLPSVHFFMRWMWWMILHLGSTFDGWNPHQFGSSLWNYLKGLFSHPRWWPEIWGINSFSIDAHEWDDQHGHSVVKVLWSSYILKLFCHPLETLLAISQPFSAQHRGSTCTTETLADISIGLVWPRAVVP